MSADRTGEISVWLRIFKSQGWGVTRGQLLVGMVFVELDKFGQGAHFRARKPGEIGLELFLESRLCCGGKVWQEVSKSVTLFIGRETIAASTIEVRGR